MSKSERPRGSAFLSCDLDPTLELREDHASYIASWIKVLRTSALSCSNTRHDLMQHGFAIRAEQFGVDCCGRTRGDF